MSWFGSFAGAWFGGWFGAIVVAPPPFDGLGAALPYGQVFGEFMARIRITNPTTSTLNRLVDGRIVSGPVVAGVVGAWTGYPVTGTPSIPPGLPTGAVVLP